MSTEPVIHGTVVVERRLNAAPARAFAAWSTQEALVAWSVPGDDGWDVSFQEFDFRVGGGEVSEFGPKGGERYGNRTVYLDIVENTRIVSAGSMTNGGERFFAGLMTAEFAPDGDGCRIKLTEQGAFFGGPDGDKPEYHETGWNEIFDKLERYLGR